MQCSCIFVVVFRRDILIVTAQVLLDALARKEIAGINKFSLIVFDECHHTHANHTFNQIMGRYMDIKFHKHDAGLLPQVLIITIIIIVMHPLRRRGVNCFAMLVGMFVGQ